MRRSQSLPCCACIALALLLLTGVSARADLIRWGYKWTPRPTTIATNGGGTGWLALTNEPSKAAAGNSNTVITNIRAFSTATQDHPDQFNHAPFSSTLQLKDAASNATGSLTVSGFFNGPLTAKSANAKITFTSPTTQTLTLGGNTYTVTMGNYSPPGPPDASNAGSLNALVSVAPGTGGNVGGAPEPATLTLAALALPCAGLAGWRKRKKGRKCLSASVA